MAARAQCALGSASQAINGSGSVSPLMRERVLRAAAELGYVPNRHARNLKSGRTHRLGLLLPFASDTHYAALLDALNETVMETANRLDIQFHRWIEAEEEKAIRYFVEAGMEGAILIRNRVSYQHSAGLRLLKQLQIPSVILSSGQRMKSSLPIPEVIMDYGTGVELLVEHLVTLGHRKIALLNPAENRRAPEIKARMDAVENAVRRYPELSIETVYMHAREGIPSRKDFKAHGISAAEFQVYIGTLVNKFLDHNTSATAAIVSNQMTARMLIEALRIRGIRVPDDFSVVTSGFTAMENFSGIPLSMAEFAPMDVASAAVRIVTDQSRQGSATTIISPSLVCRSSSGPAPAQAPFHRKNNP